MKFSDYKRNKKKVVGVQDSDIFFRSSANGWSLDNRFSQFGKHNYVCRNVKLNKGVTEFKIADTHYSNINFGESKQFSAIPNRRYVDLTNNTQNNGRIFRTEETTADIFIDTENGLKILIR